MEDILKLITAKSGLDKETLVSKIDNKYQELGGVVTREGAAYLVARQMGIDLPSSKFEIKDIQATSRNVNVIGRIVRITPITEFKRLDGSKGTVANIFIADSTGQIKISLWNDQTQIIQQCKAGDVVQVMNGIVKQSNYGLDVSIGKYGGVRKLDDTGDIPSLDKLTNPVNERTNIASAKIGRAELKGTIVQVFKINNSTLVSFLLDDGSGDIRIAMFGENAKRITENSEQAYDFTKSNLEGREFIFTGRVKQSSFSDRLEMIAEDFKSLNPLEESKRLLDEVKVLIGE